MTGPSDSRHAPIDAATLMVRRLYGKYMTDVGITFTELLIVAELNDGGEHEVTDVAARLKLDASLMNSSIANLERVKFIDQLYPSASRLSSIRLVADAQPIAQRLLVIQANVDLDVCIASEQINQLRKSLLLLARRTSQRSMYR